MRENELRASRLESTGIARATWMSTVWGVRPARLALVLLLASLTGCLGFVEGDSEPRAPQPLEASVAQRFAYVANLESVSLTKSWEDDEVEVSSGVIEVLVPAAAWSDDDGSHKVEFEYWRSKLAPAGRGPAVLVTPILGGGKTLARTNCEDFARAGYHVVLVWRGVRVLRSSWTTQEPERWMRKAVGARRALLDWMETRPEIDKDRVAAFGISMGGIITTVLLAAEPRFACGVVALAGGDVGGVIAVSSEGRLERYFAAKLEETGMGPVELEQHLRGAFPSDPLHMAPAVDAKRLLQITTEFDTVVPLRNQLLLWEALGRPPRWHVPSGHYTAILWLGAVTDEIIEFYRDKLRPRSESPAGTDPALAKAGR
jgi:pimeloyl-ACP methyl ester carboxylesterase